MSSHRRAGGPRGLAAVLSKVTRPLFRARGFGASGLLTDWPDIVGRPLADFTLPERLGRDGVLAVRVADGGWALELRHIEPVVIERIASYFGYPAVTRLALVQGPLPSRPASRRRSPRALDAGEEAALSARLSDAGDPGLRAALERLGRAVFGSTPAAGGGAPRDTRHDTPRSDGA
jgi:hypothetical protein